MADYSVSSTRRLVMNDCVASTLGAGDGQILFCVPVSEAYIEGIVWALDYKGAASAATELNINRVRAESDTEMVSAVSSIAYGASVTYAEIGSTLQNNILVKGDIVRVDIDTVPGTASAGLAVTLILHVVED